MIQRGGEVVIRMLANVQQATIKPLIKATIAPASLIYTDEYAIYTPVTKWGYEHKTVCHGRGEYARDEDGDGLCEVHVNTWKDFGLSYARGYVPIEASLKKSYPCTWAFSSLSTMPNSEGKQCLRALLETILT